MKSGKLNIYRRDIHLEKEEIDRMLTFIDNDVAKFLFVTNALKFGIIKLDKVDDPSFKVQAGTNSNSIKLLGSTTRGGNYAIDKVGNLIFLPPKDNIEVPTIGEHYWVKISHKYDIVEDGTISVDLNGNVSGSSTIFTDVLRGQSSGFPVFVKLYTENSDGTYSVSENNPSVYEVVQVVSDGVAILGGDFTAESNLKYVVLGCYAIGSPIYDNEEDGLYLYDSCKVELVKELISETEPTSVEGEEFFIARVLAVPGTGNIEIQDKRSSKYYTLDIQNISTSSKAEIDASNLSSGNVTSWLTKLSVLTASEISTLLANKADKGGTNLTNAGTWRNNLSVYETGEVDALLQGKADDDIVVKKTGAQTIDDVKTFSSFPKIPITTPSDDEPISKAYFDEQFGSDTGWLNCIDGGNLSSFTIKARQRGKLVIIQGEFDVVADGDSTICTIPAEIEVSSVKVFGSAVDSNNNGVTELSINAGSRDIVANSATGANVTFNMSYFVD